MKNSKRRSQRPCEVCGQATRRSSEGPARYQHSCPGLHGIGGSGEFGFADLSATGASPHSLRGDSIRGGAGSSFEPHGRHASEEAIYNFIWRLRIAAAILPPRPLAQTPIRDPNDIPILQTALSGQADVLCTCDRDFFAPPASGFLKKREIDVLTDVELMRRLRA